MKTATVNEGPRRAWATCLLIAVFLLLLWAPTADEIFHLDGSRAAAENRLPARPPNVGELRAGNVQKFLAAGEAYFNDHFGFRKKLIRWFQNWKLGIYHDRTVYKVLTGPNRWLFTGEEQMVEHYLGAAKFTPQQLQTWQALLEKRRDWLAAHGIKYLFVVPPDKQDIYPEELPAWLRNAAPTNRVSKLDQFLKHMQAHSTVEILDLRAPLLAAKQTAPTYLQNDTHWNLFGGFVASQEVIRTLTKQLPGLPPLRTEDFNWTNVPFNSGDLARMLGTDAPEKNYFKPLPKPSVSLPVLREATNLVSAWNSHKSNVISENSAPALTATAMVFHDSFGNAWRQFLGCSFKRIIYMGENREFNQKFIQENRPQVVINEILERYFNMQNPQELLASDHLP
ncbi:MAG TPA: alginate O-acetyltransferase [Verrucomicrobiae bacterium]